MPDNPVHPMGQTESESRRASWTIIHRTPAEYDRHFPKLAEYVEKALKQAFPQAKIRHENFLQDAEEPIVIPPEGTSPEVKTQFQEKVRIAWEKIFSSLFDTPKSEESPQSIDEEAHQIKLDPPPAGSDSGHAAPQEATGSSPSIAPAGADPSSPTVPAEEIDSSWLVVIPMFQLTISDVPPISGSWRVGDVTFVSLNQLAARLQPPNLPKLLRPRIWQRVAASDTAFALVSRTGTPSKIRQSVYREVREAANILASTAAFYGKRHHSCGFTLRGYPFHTAKQDAFLETEGTAFCGNWSQRGMLMPFELDTAWHAAIEQTGFINLFDRIGDTTIAPNWRRQICSGAAMLGRSLMSLDLADAFLLNVIGLETLLTRRNERNGRLLARRIKGMTGWHLRQANPGYEDEIQKIHAVRCEIVHDSDYSNLGMELLLQSDVYLANSLLNIVKSPVAFPDKDALATKLDDFATHENWPSDGSLSFQWVGSSRLSTHDLDLPLW